MNENLCSKKKKKYWLVAFVLFIVGLLLIDLTPHSSSHLRHYRSIGHRHVIGRVFIALNLFQSEDLLRDGSWFRTMIELIERLGSKNVFLSIFENDSTDLTPTLLRKFSGQIQCENQIITTKLHRHYQMSRIEYLAMIRNRALEPLINRSTQFSKVVFLNDIVFSSDDVLNLLKTNQGDYTAACALDFINPIKFYDTLATRDRHGYSMGLPIYPFFGPGITRDEVLRGDSLIRVKSCWSGLVAFDIRPFQQGLRFRSLENQSNIDASECCLIHADIDQPNRTWINQNVRVAYSSNVYHWQKRFQSFESLWSFPQRLISSFARLPRYNEHRTSPNGGFCWINEKLTFKKAS